MAATKNASVRSVGAFPQRLDQARSEALSHGAKMLAPPKTHADRGVGGPGYDGYDGVGYVGGY